MVQIEEQRGSRKPPLFKQHSSSASAAFTLVELLIIIGIIVLMLSLLIPVFNSLKGAGDITKATYDIAGVFEQARAYALSNNTFVYVGIAEVDNSVDSSTAPQVTTGAAPYGRVAVAVVASKDGTRGYDINNPGTATSGSAGTWFGSYANGSRLIALSKIQRFENLHLSSSTLPVTGNMNRPALTSPTSYNLGATTCASVTPFTWPLGSALAVGSGQYYFIKVINFDPQGVARIQYGSNSDEIKQNMEMGLVQTHGTAVPATPTNMSAIQLDPMTGSTRVYRP